MMISCIKGNNRENRVDTEMEGTIYHEKQSKEMCALHALNNLFQDPNAFSRKQLDDMCFRLSPNNLINPHKSVFGLGNYDINVIMASLQTKGFEAIWFDKRKNIEHLVLENVHGFILNIPTEYKWGIFRLPFHRKHWIGIREILGVYYNLDSKLDAPEVIGKSNKLLSFLQEQILDRDKELLLVVGTDVAEGRSWYREKGLVKCTETAEFNGESEHVSDEDRLKIDTANCAIDDAMTTYRIAENSGTSSLVFVECKTNNGNNGGFVSGNESPFVMDTQQVASPNGLCNDFNYGSSCADSTSSNHFQSVGVCGKVS